jgi:hypothetical protein
MGPPAGESLFELLILEQDPTLTMKRTPSPKIKVIILLFMPTI